MLAKHRHELSTAVKGGIVAGIVGGIAIAIILLLSTIGRGMDPWPALKGAGTPFLHQRAMLPGFDALAVLVGVLCHFAVSIGWGILFGVLFWGLSRPATVLAGALWGIVVWLGMYYVVLPLVGLGGVAASVPIGAAILNHVVFGLFVGIGFLPFQHELPRPMNLSGPATP